MEQKIEGQFFLSICLNIWWTEVGNISIKNLVSPRWTGGLTMALSLSLWFGHQHSLPRVPRTRCVVARRVIMPCTILNDRKNYDLTTESWNTTKMMDINQHNHFLIDSLISPLNGRLWRRATYIKSMCVQLKWPACAPAQCVSLSVCRFDDNCLWHIKKLPAVEDIDACSCPRDCNATQRNTSRIYPFFRYRLFFVVSSSKLRLTRIVDDTYTRLYILYYSTGDSIERQTNLKTLKI